MKTQTRSSFWWYFSLAIIFVLANAALISASVNSSSLEEEFDLVLEAGGRRWGEESYQLVSKVEDGLEMTSKGSFFIPLGLPFYRPKMDTAQRYLLSSDHMPKFYQLTISGPFGLGRSTIKIEFSQNYAFINKGGKESIKPLNQDVVLILSTPSTYALLSRMVREVKSFQVLSVEYLFQQTEGKSEGALSDEDTDPGLLDVKVKEVDKIGIDTNLTGEIQVKRHTLTIGNRTGILLTKGSEFIAYIGGTPEGEFKVYRADIGQPKLLPT